MTFAEIAFSQELSRQLRSLKNDFLTHDVIREIEKEILRKLKSQLIKGKNLEGKRFKPLAPGTIRQRESAGIAGTTPMVATKSLVNSLISQRTSSGFGNSKQTTVLIGPGNPRANILTKIHHKGGRIPVRDILALSSSMDREVDNKITRELQRKCRATLR